MKKTLSLLIFLFYFNGFVSAQIEPLTATFQGQPGCQGSASVTILAKGGYPPYEYSADGLNYQSSNKIILTNFYNTGSGIAMVRDSTGTIFSGPYIIEPSISYSDTYVSVLCGNDFQYDGSTTPILLNVTKDTIFNYSYIDIKCNRIIFRIVIHIVPAYQKNDTIQICAGTNFTFPDQVRASNILTDTFHVSKFKTTQGCDSVINTFLRVSHPEELQTDTICKGSAYTFPDGTSVEKIDLPLIQHSFARTQNSCIIDIITQLYLKEVDISIYQSGNLFASNAKGASYQWGYCKEESKSGFTPIPSQISQTLQVLNDEYYAVVVTQNGCIDTSACLSMLITGNDEININGISLFPNPVKETLMVQFLNNMNDGVLQVFSSMGNKVYEQKLFNTTVTSIPFEFAPTGMYYVKISGNKAINVFPLFKE